MKRLFLFLLIIPSLLQAQDSYWSIGGFYDTSKETVCRLAGEDEWNSTQYHVGSVWIVPKTTIGGTIYECHYSLIRDSDGSVANPDHYDNILHQYTCAPSSPYFYDGQCNVDPYTNPCTDLEGQQTFHAGSGDIVPAVICANGCQSYNNTSIVTVNKWTATYTYSNEQCTGDNPVNDPLTDPDPNCTYTEQGQQVCIEPDSVTEFDGIPILPSDRDGCMVIGEDEFCQDEPQNCGYFNNEYVCSSPIETTDSLVCVDNGSETFCINQDVKVTESTQTVSNPDGSTTTTVTKTSNIKNSSTETTVINNYPDGSSDSETTYENGEKTEEPSSSDPAPSELGTESTLQESGESYFDSIGNAPIVVALDDLGSQFPTGGTCPAIEFTTDLTGHVYSDLHCDIYLQIEPVLSVVMKAVWVLLGIVILFGA